MPVSRPASVARGVKIGQEKRAERDAAKDPQAVFTKYDTDSRGGIDVNELSAALKELRVNATRAQLELVVKEHGQNGAMNFNGFERLLRALSEQQDAMEKAKLDNLGQVYGEFTMPYQEQMVHFYNNPSVVYGVASCIIGNFFINIIEKEMDPMGILHTGTWMALDYLFNSIFLAELFVNMYQFGGPKKRFWRSAWNCFDFFIVSVSVVLMIGGDGLPVFLKKLKLLRAFRVFRLFKRIKSLNQIIVALIASVPGVLNAFVLMIIVFCIYAILAVELFSPFGNTGTYPVFWQADCKTPEGTACAQPSAGPDGSLAVSSMTARGYTNGYEYYGTFSRALYTLFQVMTGESWSEAIARPLIFGQYEHGAVAGIFYVSFILLTQVVLINVVVAILIDKFTLGDEAEPEEVDGQALLDRMEELEKPVLSGSSAAKAVGDSKHLWPQHLRESTDEKVDKILGLLERLERRVAAMEVHAV